MKGEQIAVPVELETKGLPADKAAEQLLLAGLLRKPDCIDEVMEQVTPEEFSSAKYRAIYTAMIALQHKGELIDGQTVVDYLRDTEQLDELGGELALQDIFNRAQGMVTSKGLARIATRIRECMNRRRLIQRLYGVMESAYDMTQDVMSLCAESEQAILSMTDQQTDERFALTSLSGMIRAAADRRKAADARGESDGYRPMIGKLQNFLCPWQPGEYVIIGGESSYGKSVLALQSAISMAQQGATGLIVSMEMSKDALAKRMLKAHFGSDIPADAESVRWRKQEDNAEWLYAQWEATAQHYDGHNILLSDNPDVSPNDLLLMGRRAKKLFGGRLDFIVVDYLQLLRSDDGNQEDTPRITSVSRNLKRVAMQLQTAVIAVSSLNRPTGEQGNKRPNLHRIRASGQVGYDSDCALFLHRPNPQDKGTLEVIVAKQRQGSTAENGEIVLHLDFERVWFF